MSIHRWILARHRSRRQGPTESYSWTRNEPLVAVRIEERFTHHRSQWLEPCAASSNHPSTRSAFERAASAAACRSRSARTRRRRTRRFWPGLAGAVAIGTLASVVVVGVWLQWGHEPLSPQDPTGGLRDYFWCEHRAALVASIAKLRKNGREVDCPLSLS